MEPTLRSVSIQARPSQTAVRAARRQGRRPSSALRRERRCACSASQVDRPRAASSLVRRSVGSPWPANQQRVVSERSACPPA
eukprot:10739223-Alexandrium_andersonii.AAC.1